MIRARKSEKAFHPNAAFEILEIDRRIFASKRYTEDQTVVAMIHISAAEISLSQKGTPDRMTDLITGETVDPDLFTLKPCQFVWSASNDSYLN